MAGAELEGMLFSLKIVNQQDLLLVFSMSTNDFEKISTNDNEIYWDTMQAFVTLATNITGAPSS